MDDDWGLMVPEFDDNLNYKERRGRGRGRRP